MESKALKEYGVPGYPKKEDVQVQPSLLRKSFDKRWQRLFDVGVSGMLAASITLSGCEEGHKANNNSLNSSLIENTPDSDKSITKTESVKHIKKIVAPIFEHGEGRGSTGCMSITPPSFISEDEALVIIKEELAKHGLKLNHEKVALDEVEIAHGKTKHLILGLIPIEWREEGQHGVEPFEIDLQNSDKGIYIEYVSREDYFKLGGAKSEWSIQDYDFKKVAVKTRQKLNKDSEQGVYAVLYDPMFSPDYSSVINSEDRYDRDKIQIMHQKGMESSKELLRNQVSDFAKWLKEQGVI